MPLDFENVDLGSFGVNDKTQTNLNEAVKINPDKHAKDLQTSRDSGVPAFAVDESVEQNQKFKNIDFSGMTKRNPKTSEFLGDFDNAVVAQDDTTIMGDIENIFSGFFDSAKIGFEQQGLGASLKLLEQETTNPLTGELEENGIPTGLLQFIRQAGVSLQGHFAGDENARVSIKRASDNLLTQIKAKGEERKALQPEGLGIVGQGLRGGAESLVNMVPSIIAFGITKGRSGAMLSTIGVQTYSEKYGEAIEKGLSPDEANDFATLQATIEVGTELGGAKVASELVKGVGKKFVKGIRDFLAQDFIGEQAATAWQSVVDYQYGLDEQMAAASSTTERVAIQAERQAVTAIATMFAGSIQGAAFSGVGKVVEKVQGDQQIIETQSEIEQQKIDKLNDTSTESKLKERDPEAFRKFVESAGEGSNVYIDGAQASLYMQEKTPDEIQGDPALQAIAAQVVEAAQLGGDVVIPVADFATDITGTETFDALRPHMTMSAESVSPFRQETEKTETDSFVENLVDQAEQDVSQFVEAQEGFETLKTQLIDSGQVTAQNADKMAQVFPAWATVYAKKNGVTVQEAYDRAGLTIEGPQTGEAARQSAETLTQESVKDLESRIGVDLAISELGDVVTIDKIVVPEDARDGGIGTAAMKEITAWADANGKTLALTPSKDFGGNVKRLKEFYKREGFVENKGKNKDFEVSESMVRVPATTFAQSEIDQTETDEFKAWSEGGDVIESEDLSDHVFTPDTPVVLKVFHGTTHNFSVFDALSGNLESQFGAVNYFTSSEQDASDNYAGEGPDLTNRIEQRAEQIEQEIEDTDPDVLQELADKFGLEMVEGEAFPDDLPRSMAQEELAGGEDQVMELYVRVDNPFVIDQMAPQWVEFVDNEQIQSDAVVRVAEENDVEVSEVNENPDEYEDQIDEARWEIEADTEHVLVEAIQTVADRHDVDASNLASEVHELDGSATAEDIEALLRASEDYAYAEGEQGEVIQSQMIMEVIEEMGFDSIVLNKADQRFSTMEMESDTTHVHIFDSNKTNIKSVDNVGTFDATDPDIFKQKTDEGVRGFYDPQNSVIRLTEASDLSTFLHEFAHFMYEMELKAGNGTIDSINSWYKRNASDVAKEASEERQGTTEEDVINYLDSGATGSTKTDEAIRRAVHEQFARGFEKYLMEGKAPSVELRNAFRTFARWLTQVYKSIRGDLQVNLDAEMKEVFDRLLATEEQIEAAKARQRVEPLFTDAAMAGMTDKEFTDYQERQSKVEDKQAETLREQLIKEITKRQGKEWKAEKDDLVDEEIETLKTERVYVARESLSSSASTAELDEQIIGLDKEIIKLEKQQKALEKGNDTVGKFLAKAGGLNRLSMAEEGIDQENFKAKSRVFGKPLFPKEGGLTADDVAELLNQENFDGGELSANDALEIIQEMLSEDNVYIDPEVSAQLDQIDNAIGEMEADRRDADGQRQTLNVKLDNRTVREMVGEEKTDKIGRKSVRLPVALKGMTDSEGVHPDEAAAMLGYGSGSELLFDLTRAPKLKDQANENAEKRMLETHGDIMNDGSIERLADEALQSEERGRILLHELKVLSRGTNQKAIERKAIQDAARDNIAKLTTRQINPGKYRRAEIKAAQEAATALASGDKQLAAAAKARQVMNFYLGKEATEAKNETLKIVDRMNRYNKKKVREEIMKAENGYWEQIVKILERFEFRKSATLRQVDAVNESIALWASDRINNEGDGLVITPMVMNELIVTHWKNVPFGELTGIDDSVKNIEHVARYGNKIRNMDEEIEFKKLVDQWVRHMDAQPNVFKATRGTTLEDKNWLRAGMAQMTKVPYLASWLDGGERVGMSHEILMDNLNVASKDEQLLWKETGTVVMDAIENRSKDDQARHLQKIYIPEIHDTFEGTLTGGQVLSVALNTGNAGNLRKMVLGEGWALPENEGDISIDNVQLQAVLKHMTKGDWDLVQLVWDQMNMLYPKLAEVHRKTTGLVPPKVEAQSITNEHGTFAGGYYPTVYDPARSAKAAVNADKAAAQLESMFGGAMSLQAAVNTGATNERTGFYGPIKFNLDVIPNHFQETIHYITHHDAVRQINKLINDKSVRETITAKLGPDEYAQLKPWLNDVAKDGSNAPPKTIIDEAFSRLRMGVTLGVMGFKASTGIIQISGIFNTYAEIGSKHVHKAARTVYSRGLDSANDARTFAFEHSNVMENRAKTMDREIKNVMKKLEGKKGALAVAQEASMKHIAFIQFYGADLISWHAGYSSKLEETGDPEKAYKYADWVVENIQGSGATKDMATLFRNQSKTHTTFTMFMTFFSSLWNMERDLTRDVKAGRLSTSTVSAKLMFLFALPVLFEMMMRAEVDPDDDALAQKMLTKLALYPVASIPFVRDIASGVGSQYGYNSTPVASNIEQGLQAIKGLGNAALSDKEITKGQVKGATKFLGAVKGVPGVSQAWATGEHLYEVIEEGEDFSAHSLLFGPKKK